MDIFLDSGAFSAWTQKVEIDIQEYIAFIKKYEHLLFAYACLDVIGDAKASYKNQRIMEDAGLKPVPVFHRYEPLKYLRKYVEKYDYIALGGLVGFGQLKRTVMGHLDKCFDFICDTPDNLPKVKVHGFGITSIKAMLRYPWYSVDSATWAKHAAYGKIHLPGLKYVEGQLVTDFTQLHTISCSNQIMPHITQKLKNKIPPYSHYSNLKKIQKSIITEYIKTLGFDMGYAEVNLKPIEYEENEEKGERCIKIDPVREKKYIETIISKGVTNDPYARRDVNLIYFEELKKQCKPWPWSYKTPNRGFDI